VADTDGKRTSAGSRVYFKSLSPGEKESRMASLAKDRMIYRQTAGRLRTELQSSKATFKLLDCGSSFRTLISKAFTTLATLDTKEKAEAKHIIAELIGVSAAEASDKINKEEAANFAAYIWTPTKAVHVGGFVYDPE
jgi:hypothetical protein